MKKIIFTLLAFTILGFSSCYYDKEAKLYPAKITTGSTCDTSTTTLVYSNTIKTIMDQNCSLSGCHNTNSASSGVVTDTYADLKDAMTNNSFFICSIEQTNCSSNMPKNGAKLPDCKISQIKIWRDRNFPQ